MPTFRRTRDYVYLAFFAIHIPLVLCVDLYPLYPRALVPRGLTALRAWYVQTYRDRFFVAPPAWFTLYMWMELLYHIPLSLYAVAALWSGRDPRLPVHLLIYAVQTAVTTATCIADYLSWSDLTSAAKVDLGTLYVPYLMVSVFMGVDMYSRLVAAADGRYLGGREGVRAKKRN